MHELGVTKTIIKEVLDEMESRKMGGLSEVVIELGRLTSYSGESIKFYFDILKAEEPMLENANLSVIDVGARVHCRRCGEDSNLEDTLMFFCPSCKSLELDVVRGMEFIIKSIKV